MKITEGIGTLGLLGLLSWIIFSLGGWKLALGIFLFFLFAGMICDD